MCKGKLFLLWGCCFLSFNLLLNGCSNTSHRDGPPSYNVDVSKIPDAQPKKEPLAKYGNMPTYHVFGKKYYVMKSAQNYHEQGIASWYGMKFHHQRTSSGERYDLVGMTAAHKTLPLPTYVQVTNLTNNRKVIVKINDRGPFSDNRIIDLSYAAAKKLGMLAHGTAQVDIRAINCDPPQQSHFFLASLFTHHSVKKTDDAVYLQIGAFRNKIYAEKLRNRLQPLISSPIQIAQASQNLYRVKIGPIKDIATATKITKKLHEIGLKVNHSSG